MQLLYNRTFLNFPMSVRLALLCLAAARITLAATCTFQLTPASLNFGYTSNDAVISISASDSSCVRTASSNSSWITISFGSSGTGSGTVGFTVSQNNSSAVRSGSLTIAGINVPVTQAGAPCTYGITPSSANVSSAGASGTFSINTACSWAAASNNPDWLTASGSGTGNGSIRWTAAPNAVATARTGTITAGTQTFTVTQGASCTFNLSPFSAQVDPSGASNGTFQIQASSASCSWTAVSNNPDFVTIASGGSGVGNGTVNFSVTPNTGQGARTATITVGASTFLIYQPGGFTCTYSLNPPTASFAASGGGGNFHVVSNCPWTPAAGADWITLLSPASSTGTDTVYYAVSASASSNSRTGTITIGSPSFPIMQAGVPCQVSIPQTNLAIGPDGATGTLDVSAPPDCTWTATAGANWISVTPASGTGPGPVSYAIPATTAPQGRNSQITVSNQVIPVAQTPPSCSAVLTPDRAGLPAAGGNFTVHIDTNCNYTAQSGSPLVTIISGSTGNAPSDIAYTVPANPLADSRTASIRIGALTFPITQAGASAGCTASLSPGSAGAEARGASGSIDVASAANCRWQATTDQGWIHLTYASVNGTGRISYVVDRNTDPAPRSGNIFAAGQSFAIAQAAAPILRISAAGIVNAASSQAGPVAPGEIVTIYGSGIGPSVPQQLQLTADRQRISTGVAGARVFFDGTAAPVLYASSSQVNVIVPYGIAARSTTVVRVELQGFRSNDVSMAVAASAPGIFSMDGSGTGPGAILNQDGSLNSAAAPAGRGSVVVLFGTGEGSTQPDGVDGKLAVRPLSKPVLPVSVQIGGVDARVVYSGAAPGFAGLLQINAVVPDSVEKGNLPVSIRVGDAVSQTGITLAVK